MNIWRSIMLQDVGPFKNVSFKVPKGISTIYGSNGSASDPNAAGKSMIFSSIFDTMYETPIAAEKTDRIQTGTRAVSLMLGESSVMLKRVGNKASLKVDDTVVTGIVNVRRKLAEVLPWTWEDIVTYVHLDAQTPHPLVKGTNAHRKQFLTSFFNLDKIDAEKKIIKMALDDAAKAEPEHGRLLAEAHSLKTKLPPEGLVDKLVKKHKAKTKELSVLREDSAGAELRRRARLFADQASSELDHFRKGKDESGCNRLADVLAYYSKMYDDTLIKLETAEAYAEHKEQQDRYDSWAQSLSPETIAFLKSGQVDTDPSAIALRVARAKREVATLRERLEDLRDDVADIEEVRKPNVEYRVAQNAVETLQHKLDHAEQFGEGECPTCGQAVAIDSPDELRAKLRKATAAVHRWADYHAYEDAKTRQERARKEWTACKKKLKAAQEFITENSKYVKIEEELRNPPKKPKPFSGSTLHPQVVRKVLEEVEARLKALRFLTKHRDMLAALRDARTAGSSDMGDSDLERAAVLAREITQIEAKLERAKALDARLAEVEERLNELKPIISRARALRELLQGYDDKAMKRLVIQAISTRLMQEVNKYAKLAFKDDFRFELVWDSTSVEFLVHRHFGTRVDTTDVRRLSGAETKLFTIVLVMALLSFVPTDKRSSMLVLDEPTAHMGPAAIEIFRQLLPILATMIPSIVIITPRSEDRFGGKEFTVVKRNGAASIVEGHPNTLRNT